MNLSGGDGFSLPASMGGFPQLQQDHSHAPNPTNPKPNPPNPKRRRNQPGTPDPDAEVMALSPKTLMATNRFVCEICNKGFQRDQNLQLHRRGHNLPWKLRQRSSKEQARKKVYICPEETCVHHHPSRALGDLTGIKKHFSRKHGEKKWKCDKCAKKYAVMSDWKAHAKICGTREYKCDCGTIFSRKDSFITHRVFCDALTEERMRVSNIGAAASMNPNFRVDMSFISSTPQSITPFSTSHGPEFMSFESSTTAAANNKPRLPLWLDHQMELQGNGFLGSSSGGTAGHVLPEFPTSNFNLFSPHSVLKNEEDNGKSSYPQGLFSLYSSQPQHQPLSSATTGCSMSATALLQKAARIGSTRSENNSTAFANSSLSPSTPMLSNSHVPGGGFSGQLMMMGPSGGGMRDFLGTLGGSTSTSRVDVSNDDTGAGENERRVALQEEMAYNLATMAAGAHQEPYMDLMR